MNTLDRINRLRKHYGLHTIGVAAMMIPYRPDGSRSAIITPPIHNIIDEIDFKALFNSGRNHGNGVSGYVGARLARLERHAFADLARYHFWLGAES